MIMLYKSLAAPLIGVGLLTAGCQSSGSSMVSDSTGPTTAPIVLTCSKCQTSYTRVPVISGNSRAEYRIVRYRTVHSHECSECTNVVTRWLKLSKSSVPGEVIHSCKSCGGEVKVCHKEEL